MNGNTTMASQSASAVYDSAEEAEREFRQQIAKAGLARQAPAQPSNGTAAALRTKLRVIRRPKAEQESSNNNNNNNNNSGAAWRMPRVAQAGTGHAPAPAEGVPQNEGPHQGGAPQNAAHVAHTPIPPARTFAVAPSASFAASPSPTPAFPSTLFWGDKLQTLGAVYLVAEALVRSLLMDSEEFVDRVAWVVLERMVADRMAAGAGSAPDATPPRLRHLNAIRRELGEIRSTHAAFHTVSNSSIVHGAVLVLQRVVQLAALSSEFAAAPFAYTLDRHVQDLVFLCDFTAMVLGKIQLGGGPQHEPMAETREGMPALWMPAHYANEAMVRGLAPLDIERSPDAQPSTNARTASRLLQEQSQALSNTWLARNLLRLALGFRTVGVALEAETGQQEGGAETGLLEEGHGELRDAKASLRAACKASLQEILRDRSSAIQAWTKRNGIDTAAVFMDPLYRVEAELMPARG